MFSTNGRADTVGPPIQLGDFLPERRQVVLNGQPYQAWVAENRRYPRTIMARLDRAARIYNRVVAPLLVPKEQQDLTDDVQNEERLRAMDMQPEAWEAYVSECVMLLVPGILESEVELVDLAILENLLRDLGYFKAAEATVESNKPSEDNQQNDPLTGATVPEDSLTSIPGTM